MCTLFRSSGSPYLDGQLGQLVLCVVRLVVCFLKLRLCVAQPAPALLKLALKPSEHGCFFFSPFLPEPVYWCVLVCAGVYWCVLVCVLPAVSGSLSAPLDAAAAVAGCVFAAARCVCVCPAAVVCIASALPPDSSSGIESLHPEHSADPSVTHTCTQTDKVGLNKL